MYTQQRNKKKTQKIALTVLASFIAFQLSPAYILSSYADDAVIADTSTSVESGLPLLTTETEPEDTPAETASTTTLETLPLLESTASTTASTTETASTTNATTTPGALIADETTFGTTTPEFVIPTEFVTSSTSTASSTATSTNTLATSTPENATSTTATTSVNIDTDEGGAEDIEDAETADDTNTTTLPTGTTTVTTGDAVALANILNIVNTNLVNSTGSVVMANLFDNHEGNLDLRSSPTSSSTCTLSSCNGIDTVTTNLSSDASIENDITIVATSGENLIETAENAAISSGDTYAGLNLVNVANTNLVDSNYLLVTLNAFKSFTGDIVFPSLASFFSNHSSAAPSTNIDTNQSGAIENNLDVQANAGENTTESVQGTTNTGHSMSATNVFNNLNTSLIGGNSISVLLKVSGTWIGQLFGIPLGNVFVEQNGAHILSYGDTGTTTQTATQNYNLMSTSTAAISNDIDVIADSGRNAIKDAGTSTIDTGTALAAANIVNIANANIVGRNWILAIINIFGDFTGNISFGMADMWLGMQVSASETHIANDTVLTYKLTAINRGDSPATSAKLTSSYDAAHLTLIDSNTPYTENGSGNIVFDLGSMGPNDAKEIIFTAKLHDTTPGMNIVNTSTITLHEPDNNTADNTDSITITTSVVNGGSGPTLPPAPYVPPVIQNSTTTPSTTGNAITIAVQRLTASTTIVGVGTIGEQKLVIRNMTNHTVPSVSFDDILRDADGNEIKREMWDLGDLLPNEEITLSYEIAFGSQAESGTYVFSSEFLQSGTPKLLYERNGFLTFVNTGGTGGSIAEEEELNGTGGPDENEEEKVRITPSTIERTDKGSVLGAFFEYFSPPTAYAEAIGGYESDGAGFGYSAIYIILFLLIAGSQIYRRYLHSRAVR